MRWQQSLDTGEPFEMEFPLRGADGVFRWFLTRVVPERDSFKALDVLRGKGHGAERVGRIVPGDGTVTLV